MAGEGSSDRTGPEGTAGPTGLGASANSPRQAWRSLQTWAIVLLGFAWLRAQQLLVEESLVLLKSLSWRKRGFSGRGRSIWFKRELQAALQILSHFIFLVLPYWKSSSKEIDLKSE